MPYFKFLIIFIILFNFSCAETVQRNGLSITKINQIKIKIGETTKDDLNNKYGPPLFESIFNNNVIYYVSHNSSYLNFNPRKTTQLIVLKITLDNNNIVKELKKYSEKDAKNIDVSKMTSSNQDNNFLFFKQMFKNINRNSNLN